MVTSREKRGFISGYRSHTPARACEGPQDKSGAYVGPVDQSQGFHRTTSTKTVIVWLNVQDCDAYYRHFKERGATSQGEPKVSERLKIRASILREPEGHVIRVQRARAPIVEPFSPFEEIEQAYQQDLIGHETKSSWTASSSRSILGVYVPVREGTLIRL